MPSEAERQAFALVRQTIAVHGDSLRAISDVVDVRPGCRFKDSWITDESAVVVVVFRKLPRGELSAEKMILRVFGDVPVDVAQATPVEQFRSGATTRGAGVAVAPEYKPALPGWEDEEDATRSLEFTTLAATQPYAPPPGLALEAVEGPMTVVCHASPDAGWSTLGPFLSSTECARP